MVETFARMIETVGALRAQANVMTDPQAARRFAFMLDIIETNHSWGIA